MMTKAHSFHIPVMGIGFTIDTPLKVSPYGIDSVISLVDDVLFEKLRKMYSEKFEIPFQEISEKISDFRAKRITAYLNMINHQIDKKFDELKNAASEKNQELHDYFNMLPDTSTLKNEFKKISENFLNVNEFKNWIKENISKGSVDVNIMTKLDKVNYQKGEQLPTEFNDAHAALRGFANSNLNSSVIFSAGMNPRLYNYLEKYKDFYPDSNGNIKKKIVLKVSDYRSAIIQGKYLAKKGLWVSEYRIESGLNCGGHAFATDGFLMGPILAEFRDRRAELIETTYELLVDALSNKNFTIPTSTLPIKITAQGGVGTSEEHEFLLNHYQLDSVGWGTPFLLVPEVVNIDEITLQRLADAKEDDLYLSGISPLGVPFNNLRGNTKDIKKYELIEQGNPGSSCPKKYLRLNNEFTEKTICTASKKYQTLKINELKDKNLSSEDYTKNYNEIVEKSCICVGLGTSALVVNNLDTTIEGEGISVCPGPNMAYFSKITTLKEMVDHIYGRTNIITRTDRPNMFIKELHSYLDYLKNKLDETKLSVTKAQIKYLSNFEFNLNEGITYYISLFDELKNQFNTSKDGILKDLSLCKKRLLNLKLDIEKL